MPKTNMSQLHYDKFLKAVIQIWAIKFYHRLLRNNWREWCSYSYI